uniref:Histamine H2 receptor n=1 Tax=Ciona intestinalis TaxID=7719 RepID=F6UDV5_CIOIN|nr:histamine H2 receptor [Ciona intestinalis]|eukprot:XP_002125985.1 histamine H2 receptor [Ciona intestinalis]
MSDVGVTLSAEKTTSPTTVDFVGVVVDDNTFVVLRTIVLLFLLVLSLIGNSLVVLSVAQSRNNRHNPFNAFILSLASYGLLECALTISLATGFSIEETWNFGDFLTGFNASFVQLQNTGIFLTISAMAIDRFLAVTRLTKYHTHSSVHHANYAVLYTWIQSFIFALPLLFQNRMLGVTARPFVERCLCGLVEGTSVAFVVLLLILCFIIPLLITIVFLHLVNKRAKYERKRIRTSSTPHYTVYCLQESMLLKEARSAKFVSLLLFLFMAFKAPYVILDTLTQLNVGGAFYPANNSTIKVDGSKFYFQTVLSWMMFCFSSLYPVVTFIYFKEYWKRIKNWILCSNATSIINNGHLRSNPRHRRRQRRRLNENKRKKINPKSSIKHATAPSSVSSNIPSEKVTINGTSSGDNVLFRVPVLYAATDGLHLVASGKNNNNNNSPTQLPTGASEPHQVVDEVEDVRPSSVVDKRVDVRCSRDCLRDDVIDDDVIYITSDFDEDETESELNNSTNSRTLIWPHRHSSDTMWNSFVSRFSEGDPGIPPDEGISHPHTPTPDDVTNQLTVTNDCDVRGSHGNKIHPNISRPFVNDSLEDAHKDIVATTKHKSSRSKISPFGQQHAT